MTTSRAGISDDIEVVVTREDGTVERAGAVKGPDPAWWGPNAKRPRRNSRRERAIDGKVKGPDPEVWEKQ